MEVYLPSFLPFQETITRQANQPNYLPTNRATPDGHEGYKEVTLQTNRTMEKFIFALILLRPKTCSSKTNQTGKSQTGPIFYTQHQHTTKTISA